jgi:UDP-glucose 4-epimerase
LSFRNSNEVLIKSISNIINILEILKGINCTFLFASSGAIYDSRNSDFFKEGDPLFPPSPYAAIKYSSEGLCQSFLESFDIDIRIARIFSVYGEEMDRFFIYDVVKKLLFADAEIVLQGSGLQERDYLHVKDAVSGLKIIMSKGSPGEIYNLCSGIPFNLSNLTSKIKTYLDLKEINVRWDEKDTKGIRDVWYGSNEKIKNLGFRIDNSQDVKLKSTVNSIKKRILAR